MRLAEVMTLTWSGHRRLLLLLAVLLLANLLLVVARQQMLVPRVAAKEATFLRRQAEVRQLLRKQGPAATTPQQIYRQAGQDTARFLQAVPEYEDFTALIDELLVLSSRARLDIAHITYAAEQMKDGPLLKYSLDFNVTGDYERLKKFIHSLEQSVRLITIKQISLQSADDKGVNLHLSLETFFRSGSRDS